jgi:hypothetical protein
MCITEDQLRPASQTYRGVPHASDGYGVAWVFWFHVSIRDNVQLRVACLTVLSEHASDAMDIARFSDFFRIER